MRYHKLLLAIVTMLAVPILASAAMTILANVTIQNAKAVVQKDGSYAITFNIKNGAGLQTNVRYAIRMTYKNSPSDDVIIADEAVFPQSLNLLPNSITPESLTYIPSPQLKGDYDLSLVLRNQNGMPLGNVVVSTLSLPLSPIDHGIFIDPKSCYLTVLGEKNSPHYILAQGVDVLSSETLDLNCKATNLGKTAASTTASIATYFRTTFGDRVPAPDVSASLVFGPSETKLVTIPIPQPAAPQAYDSVVSLVQSGSPVSNSIVAHWVLHGESATIQSISLNKTSYRAGDIAIVSMRWTGPADLFPDSRLGASHLSTSTAIITVCGESKSVVLKGVQGTISEKINITNDCLSPSVSAKISNTKTTLDGLATTIVNHNNAPIIQTVETMPVGVTTIIIILILCAICLLIAAIIHLRKPIKNNRTRITRIVAFILMAAGAYVFSSHQALADSIDTAHFPWAYTYTWSDGTKTTYYCNIAQSQLSAIHIGPAVTYSHGSINASDGYMSTKSQPVTFNRANPFLPDNLSIGCQWLVKIDGVNTLFEDDYASVLTYYVLLTKQEHDNAWGSTQQNALLSDLESGSYYWGAPGQLDVTEDWLPSSYYQLADKKTYQIDQEISMQNVVTSGLYYVDTAQQLVFEDSPLYTTSWANDGNNEAYIAMATTSLDSGGGTIQWTTPMNQQENATMQLFNQGGTNTGSFLANTPIIINNDFSSAMIWCSNGGTQSYGVADYWIVRDSDGAVVSQLLAHSGTTANITLSNGLPAGSYHVALQIRAPFTWHSGNFMFTLAAVNIPFTVVQQPLNLSTSVTCVTGSSTSPVKLTWDNTLPFSSYIYYYNPSTRMSTYSKPYVIFRYNPITNSTTTIASINSLYQLHNGNLGANPIDTFYNTASTTDSTAVSGIPYTYTVGPILSGFIGDPPSMNIPNQSSRITACPVVGAPAAPSISGPTSGYINTPYIYNVSSVDPNGKDLFYEFDFGDPNTIGMLVRYLAASVYNLVGQPGATIDRLPITGFLHSGVSASDSHSWTTPGTYTISADAVNASFATSAPSTLTVTMSNPPAKPTLTSCSNSPTAPLTWRGGSITSTVSPASGGSGSPYQYQWSTGTGFGNWYSSNSTTTTFAQNLASTSVTYRISVQTRDSTSTVSNPLICGDVVVSGTTTNPVNPPGGSAIDLKAHKTATDAGSENPAPFKVGDSILMSWTGLTALNLDPSSRCIMNLAPTDGKVMPVMNLSANFSGFSSDVTVPAKLIPDTGNTYLPAGSYVANIACAPQYHASIFDLFRRALANPVTATSNIVPIKVLRSSIQEF